MGTAAIARHSTLLPTQLSLRSAVGVGTEFFSAIQALLGRLPTAGTFAALPLRYAARINAAIYIAAVTTDTAAGC